MRDTLVLLRPSSMLAGALLLLGGLAAGQNTPQRPRPYAVRGVRVSVEADAPLKTLLLRDGRIESIQSADLTLPPDTWVLEGDGMLAVPGFIDAWTRTGCPIPEAEAETERDASSPTEANVLIDMPLANRNGIRPSFRAAEALSFSSDELERHRKAGFGVAISSPHGELLAGFSAAVSLLGTSARESIVDDAVYQHAAFETSGRGYPSTLMGFHAQLRQFLIDARWQRELSVRHESGRPGPRPAWDPDLTVVAPLLRGEQLVVCEAQTARDVTRWLELADEFGLKLAIAGGRDCWKVADVLSRHGVPVLMDLDWGDEVEDPDAPKSKGGGVKKDEDEPSAAPEEAEEGAGAHEGESEPQEGEGGASDPEGETGEPEYDYREPLGVRREKRRLWIERRDSAIRLEEAGVSIAFSTGGGKPGDLLEKVRTLTENGLSRDVALAALTARPAELTGLGRDFGALRPGLSATFCLWTDDPLRKGAQVRWSFVEGFPQEFEVESEAKGGAPSEGVDASGRWQVRFVGDAEAPEMTLVLTMEEDGKVSGDVQTKNPMDGSNLAAQVTGKVSGKRVELSMSFALGGDFQVELELSGEFDGDAIEGDSVLQMPGNRQENRFQAERLPDRGGRQ